MKAKVNKIVDGDTFKIAGSSKSVRIRGIDAPEKGQRGYKAATNKLENLIGGKEVELKNKVIGPYKRTIADVILNGKNIKNDL